MEAYRPLLSQNVLQAGAQSISKGNIQDVHWTFLGRGGRWSWPREQLELEERDASKIPVPHIPTPTRRCKKRRDERTDSEKDETASKLNEIVGVMKDSAHHLVARSQTLAHDSLHQERVSFFQWMLEFTSRMPRHNWRDFQKQAFSLAFAYTPSDSPQGPQARPRISQEASTSSSQADHAQPHGQQYPMHPPARPAPPTGGGFLELLHSQPTEMVSHFLIWSFLCKQSVS